MDDHVKEDLDAAENDAKEQVDDSDAENPDEIDLKTEPKVEKKKGKGPGDDDPPPDDE